jgi:uncharacterized coiled-coil protein SlyX
MIFRVPVVPQRPLEVEIEASILQAQSQEIARQLEKVMQVREQLVGQLGAVQGVRASELRGQIAENEAVAASLQAKLAETAARMAAVQQQPWQGWTEQPPPPPSMADRLGIDPDAITAVFVIFSIGVIVPISLALMRRVWRRPQPVVAPPRDVESSARLERLEQAVDAIAIEIERVAESQRFVARVLTERAPARASAAIAPEGPAVGEAAPLRALGAGPMEPIQVSQRQGVKQSITPH